MATATNSRHYDTRSFDMAMSRLSSKISCARSMPFGAKKIDLLIGAKRHGVVPAHVSCNCGFTNYQASEEIP